MDIRFKGVVQIFPVITSEGTEVVIRGSDDAGRRIDINFTLADFVSYADYLASAAEQLLSGTIVPADVDDADMSCTPKRNLSTLLRRWLS